MVVEEKRSFLLIVFVVVGWCLVGGWPDSYSIGSRKWTFLGVHLADLGLELSLLLLLLLLVGVLTFSLQVLARCPALPQLLHWMN